MIISKEQRLYRWKVVYYDSFQLADQWDFSMIKMGPVSFGAALIAAPKFLNESLAVTLFELEHRTSAFASWDIRRLFFTSWDTGRHVFRVGPPELDFGSKEIMRLSISK
jgi:hypothetical protein